MTRIDADSTHTGAAGVGSTRPADDAEFVEPEEIDSDEHDLDADDIDEEVIDTDAERIARSALARGFTVSVAESLTGGAIAGALAKAPDAGEWFAGGVVAYSVHTKNRVLGVPVGPVVTAPTARQMAEGVRELLGTDAAVAVTGVGGPGDEEGRPPGTVYLAFVTADATRVTEYAFDGDPAEVVEQTVAAALRVLRDDLA